MTGSASTCARHTSEARNEPIVRRRPGAAVAAQPAPGPARPPRRLPDLFMHQSGQQSALHPAESVQPLLCGEGREEVHHVVHDVRHCRRLRHGQRRGGGGQRCGLPRVGRGRHPGRVAAHPGSRPGPPRRLRCGGCGCAGVACEDVVELLRVQSERASDHAKAAGRDAAVAGLDLRQRRVGKASDIDEVLAAHPELLTAARVHFVGGTRDTGFPRSFSCGRIRRKQQVRVEPTQPTSRDLRPSALVTRPPDGPRCDGAIPHLVEVRILSHRERLPDRHESPRLSVQPNRVEHVWLISTR